jgi:hypothetical protein
MKKFSAGGAQGRYDRRMADIEKDYAKAMTRKTGKAAEVAEAKRQQRIADAKDDLAKRTGADRTATRAAERAAESNLTKTRKYGAAKSVTQEKPAAKVTDTLGAITAPKSGLATTAKKAPAKVADKPKPSAADTSRSKFFQDSLKKGDIKKTQLGLSNLPGDQGFSSKSKVLGATKGTKTDTGKTEATKGTGTSRLARAADPKDTSAAASRARLGAAASYLNPFSYIKGVKREDPSEVNKAKGGKVKKEKTMKYAKGGSTSSKPPQPTAAERAAGAKFRKSVKDLKVTPENAAAIGRGNRSTGMAKGGKMATKFGAAMKKKSADTKGRAMMKFAKGGSIDGCAVKGKTKTSMIKMARGGAAKMRGRDSYGGAQFKKGGSC